MTHQMTLTAFGMVSRQWSVSLDGAKIGTFAADHHGGLIAMVAAARAVAETFAPITVQVAGSVISIDDASMYVSPRATDPVGKALIEAARKAPMADLARISAPER